MKGAESVPAHSRTGALLSVGDTSLTDLNDQMALPSALQIKPVGFTVHAVVTTSDLEISPAGLDFGYCTIYEAIRTQINLCNHSLLPQEFGFVGLPKVPRSCGQSGRYWAVRDEGLLP